jgi:small subunit ribosomal protein S6
MRDYELTFILPAQLDEETLQGLVDRVKGWIEATGGTVQRIDQWGRRRLAYTIEKQREGHYVFMLTRLQPAQVAAVERNLRLTEEILRFLFVQVEEQPAPPAGQAAP